MTRTFASLLLMSLLVGCETLKPMNRDQVVKIGFLGPLTGNDAPIGNDALNGAKLLIKHRGSGSFIIDLKVQDGKCAALQAARAAQQLVLIDAVLGIVGGVCTGETLGAAPVVESETVTTISPYSPDASIAKAGNYIFRTYPSNELRVQAFAAYVSKHDIKRVAVITENTDAMISMDTLLKKHLLEKQVFSKTVTSEQVSSAVSELKGKEFDILFVNSESPVLLSTLLKQLRGAGMTQSVMSIDTSDATQVLSRADTAAEGLLLVTNPSIKNANEFEAAFTAEYGAPPSSLAIAASAYDAMGALLEALDAVGPNSIKMRDYLLQLESFAGQTGTFHFDANGDVTGLSLLIKEVKGGLFTDLEQITPE